MTLKHDTIDHVELLVEASPTGDGATLWRAFASHGGIHAEGTGLTREVAIASALVHLGAEKLKSIVEK